ncbi:hypothetical protein FRC14_008259 [Serendipita sp. 396]|nr:hypothetical protein FRC14_008259 [Serendipita sp. 396]KAG8779479.1 hypothetical protein FRC15_010154 [Serendipita sp. 397]KAG8796524.1 hypothetical protein FRC16_009654 [Serendipita sp. 398]KAG8864164.1 hypothetical protein FRC20_010338 [Serendipita sp. 405]
MKFRNELANYAPRPLQLLFIRAKAVVEEASVAESDRLKRIHIARAALHLVASADEILGDDLNDEDFAYIMELNSILEAVSKDIGSPFNFYILCGDYHGVIELRHSYQAYKRVLQLDSKDNILGDNTSQRGTSQRVASPTWGSETDKFETETFQTWLSLTDKFETEGFRTGKSQRGLPKIGSSQVGSSQEARRRIKSRILCKDWCASVQLLVDSLLTPSFVQRTSC